MLRRILYLFNKNRAYLFSMFLIIFYPMVLVLVISMLLDPTEKDFALDKLTHIAVFSMLTFFVYFIILYQDKFWFIKKHRTLFTILIGLCIGTAIEIVQIFMANRTSSIYDLMADLCGILFTVLIINHTPQRIKKLKRYGI
jgi:VanZ family protein